MTTYTLRISDEGYSTEETIEAATQDDAEQIASDRADEWLETGDWDTSGGTLYLRAQWSLRERGFVAEDPEGLQVGGVYSTRDGAAGACQDAARGAGSDGDGYTVEVTDREIANGVANLTLQPEAPKCLDGKRDTHDWQSPHAIVGGIKENPGVWGHGGGVKITEVCVRCGCGRHTDTWAQNPSTGEQGLESVRYEAGEFAAELANG